MRWALRGFAWKAKGVTMQRHPATLVYRQR